MFQTQASQLKSGGLDAAFNLKEQLMKWKNLAQAALATAAFFALPCLWSGRAVAAPVIYTDRAAFNLAAGGGLSFESFESNPISGATVTYGNLSFKETFGTVDHFTNTALVNFFSAATTDGQNSIWYDDNDNSVSTLTFGLASPVTALGFDITASENNTVAIGGDLNSSINLTANTPSFFGIIDTTTPFSNVTITAGGGPNVGFDAVAYGRAIPEPSTLALLGLGLSGAALFALRKKIRGA